MEKDTEIMNELKAISPTLAAIEKVNVFEVPDNYFSDFEAKILTTIFLRDKKNNFQKVPEGYFNSLSDSILSKIKKVDNQNAAEEIKSLSAALHYLKDEQVFEVPENYFENLSDSILQKINSKESKVIAISSVKKWWKYAAAAVVTGVIAISSLLIFKQHPAPASNNGIMQLASQYKTPAELQKGIASLSDEEIIKYLEKNGNVLDEDMIIKNVDTSELPSTYDYLINENTLNNYLKEIRAESDKNTQ